MPFFLCDKLLGQRAVVEQKVHILKAMLTACTMPRSPFCNPCCQSFRKVVAVFFVHLSRLVLFIVLLTNSLIKVDHPSSPPVQFSSKLGVRNSLLVGPLNALIISRSKFVETGSELIRTSSELIRTSSELISTSSELISTNSELNPTIAELFFRSPQSMPQSSDRKRRSDTCVLN